MARGWPTAALLAVLALLLALVLAWVLLPRPDLYGSSSWSRAYLDRDGGLLRLTLAADQRYRLHTPLAQIAPSLVAATLLYEDRHFRQHPGVDPAALVRAAWTTWVSAERRVGASTITMQLARLRFGLDSSSIWGKLQQLGRALQLERHYSKDQLLEAYLALAPYGRNIEGVGAASLIYFGKAAADLTLPEALSLAVVPQHPGARNPTTVQGRKMLAEARARLFGIWLQDHPDDQWRQAQLQLPLVVRDPGALPFLAPHLTSRLQEQLPASRHGRVLTSLDPQAQQQVEQELRRYVRREGHRGINNAVALVLDRRSMQVLAYAGSADFHNPDILGQVDGIRARRSPGSTLKPLVYGLALDQGLIHPQTLLQDAPRRFGAWAPDNADQRFLGPLPAARALVRSRNLPAVTLAGLVQAPDLYGLLQQAGVAGLQGRDHYGLALVLGAGEVTMDDLARLYAMLANGGLLQPLQMLLDGPDSSGGGAEPEALLSPEAAWLVLDMLRRQGPPAAVAGSALASGASPGQLGGALAPVAWKTGTSHGFRDAWSLAVAGDLVLAVWVGRFDGRGDPAFVGRSAAGPLLGRLLARLPQGQPDAGTAGAVAGPPANLNLARVMVCPATGELANASCAEPVADWFLPGVSPLGAGDLLASGSPGIGVGGMELLLPRAPIVLAAGVSQVPLLARAAAGAKSLYWFVGNRLIGRAPADGVLLWQGRPGRHRLQAVDDQGRSASMELQLLRQPGPSQVTERASEAPS